MQRIEVRAFGLLLQELINRILLDEEIDQKETEKVKKKVGQLQQIADHCVQEQVAQRPLFTELVSILDT